MVEGGLHYGEKKKKEGQAGIVKATGGERESERGESNGKLEKIYIYIYFLKKEKIIFCLLNIKYVDLLNELKMT